MITGLVSLPLTDGTRLRGTPNVISIILGAIDAQARIDYPTLVSAESRLKAAANACINAGVMPSPGVLTAVLNSDRKARRNLNGRQAKWRRQVLEDHGFVRGKHRWMRAGGGHSV